MLRNCRNNDSLMASIYCNLDTFCRRFIKISKKNAKVFVNCSRMSELNFSKYWVRRSNSPTVSCYSLSCQNICIHTVPVRHSLFTFNRRRKKFWILPRPCRYAFRSKPCSSYAYTHVIIFLEFYIKGYYGILKILYDVYNLLKRGGTQKIKEE